MYVYLRMLRYLCVCVCVCVCVWDVQQILQQQQQAALMAATQGSYLNPMAAITAAQMQQIAAFNLNGLVAAPMTPSSGTSTPPGISATAVPSIAAQIGVNGFSALPHQTNGQPSSEHIYTNGIHPYPGNTTYSTLLCWKQLLTGCTTHLDLEQLKQY
uniref:Uncharacterized protein n=1 Tax=Cyprinus carpio TaxID=7962 RepID=A0A8C1TVA9_CYPCA